MKILVTGASGFVGGHLTTRLSADGNEVYGLIRKPQTRKYDFNIIQGNLSPESIASWITELPKDLDTVIHTAGIVHSFNNNIFDEVNYKGTLELEKALKLRYPKLHFLFISSLAAVGPCLDGIPHQEEAPLRPPSLYGKSKKKAEEYLTQNLAHNWCLTIVRPPMVIGPGDPAVLDIFKMVQSRVILGTGLKGMEKEYSFVCVYDLVELIIKCLAPSDDKVRVFFPAYPKVAKFNDIIATIASQMNVSTRTLPIPMFVISALAHFMNALQKVVSINFRLTPDKIHELAPKYWSVNSQKSIEVLHMNYQWDLERTINATYEDYKSRGWL